MDAQSIIRVLLDLYTELTQVSVAFLLCSYFILATFTIPGLS